MKNIDINSWKDYSIDTLLDFVRMYDSRPESIDKIVAAYNKAEKAHRKQERDTHEPYIIHPVAVANFLAIMKVDIDTICAGLLHDVVEDTSVTKEDIEKEFGKDVADIVDGVTKINKLDDIDPSTLNISLNEQNPENLRMLNRKKIIDSLLYDPRIIIVKLCDRLHNMLTIDVKTPVKRKAKAIETLSLYVPLANKLGIYKIQQELEDASFKWIDPMIYYRIGMSRNSLKNENMPLINEMLRNMTDVIKDNVRRIGGYDSSDGRSNDELLKDTLFIGDNLSRARIKHIYGIYDALLRLKPDDVDEATYIKELNFDRPTLEQIHDLRVVKLIMKDEDSCFAALRYLHKTYRHLDKYLKDYINTPKYNMYKSLHSTVITEDGRFVQFQIRTIEQEYRNTYGLAWELYKYEGENTRERILEEFKKYPAYKILLDIKEDKTASDLEGYQSLIDKELLNTREITVINKQTGENIQIRDDATIHDFAYRVGGPMGDHLYKATVNDKVYLLKFKRGKAIYPFGRRLRPGDEISVEFNEEIICPKPGATMERGKLETFIKRLKKMKQ